MGTSVRQGHFLGAKLRSLRKRNGLTLEELSARCVQTDATAAPSVSYLSMIENGQRMPSDDMLALLAGIFGKSPGWFLDQNTELDAVPKPAARGGLAAMPLEPSFLFAHDLLRIALPELLSQTATTGKQFAQLLIRVWQETRHNDFPDIERAAEQVGDRRMPLTPNELLAICKHLGLQIKWFEAKDESARAMVRSRFEAPNTVWINKRLKTQEPQAQVRAGVLRRPPHHAQRRRPHFTARGDVERIRGGGGRRHEHGPPRRASCLARLRVRILRGRAVVSARAFSPLPDPGGALGGSRLTPRRDIGGDDAAHDLGLAISSLAFLRRLSTGVPARCVSRQRHSAALGQHERGSGSVPALGGLPNAQNPGTSPRSWRKSRNRRSRSCRMGTGPGCIAVIRC